jgi:hypothetical protein
MAQAIETTADCPLCGEPLDTAVPDYRVAAKWRDVLDTREKWGAVSATFLAEGSIDKAAARCLIPREAARRVLSCLATEVCGCRLVTCVSCLDDSRGEL